MTSPPNEGGVPKELFGQERKVLENASDVPVNKRQVPRKETRRSPVTPKHRKLGKTTVGVIRFRGKSWYRRLSKKEKRWNR